jgi:hypothetical protein
LNAAVFGVVLYIRCAVYIFGQSAEIKRQS